MTKPNVNLPPPPYPSRITDQMALQSYHQESLTFPAPGASWHLPAFQRNESELSTRHNFSNAGHTSAHGIWFSHPVDFWIVPEFPRHKIGWSGLSPGFNSLSSPGLSCLSAFWKTSLGAFESKLVFRRV